MMAEKRICVCWLELADKHGFRFDTVQMPLKVMDAHFRSFGKEVVPVLVKKQIGVGHEAHGQWQHLESQSSDTSRVQALQVTVAATTVKICLAYRSWGIRHSRLASNTLAQPGVLVYDKAHLLTRRTAPSEI
jgi:hypothetical protein